MIYLFLSFISLFLLSFVIFNSLIPTMSNLFGKKKIYKTVNGNDMYFLLTALVNFSNYFLPMLKYIKFEIFINYTAKIDAMLKTLDFENVKLNGYNFFVIQIAAMLLGMLLSLLLFGYDIIFIICSGVLFLVLPYLKIYEQYNKKITKIIKQIPDLADLLSIMISSGIDFTNSIKKVSLILQGSLSLELKTAIDKISMGIDIKDAFCEIAAKYSLPQLDLFVRTVNMTLESGTGLSDSLNKMSEQIKNENAALAEKKAHEAPVKMLLPMTLLIFPTIFILLFAPLIISFIRSGTLF